MKSAQLAGGRIVATSGSRSALFLMESDVLALELQGILQSGDSGWRVMLTRVADAAMAALLGGPIDVAVLIPGATDAIDDLLLGLESAGTPTIVVSGVDGAACQKGLLTRIAYPVDVETLKATLRPFAGGTTPLAPPQTACA
jgi:hypothetical protein